MTQGMVVDIVRSYDKEILVEYRNEYYRLVDDNFVYFNWWFEHV